MLKWLRRLGCLLTVGCAAFTVFIIQRILIEPSFEDISKDSGECAAAIELRNSGVAQADFSPIQSDVAINSRDFAMISPTNIDELEEIGRVGRGYIRDAIWAEDNSLYVLTSIGLWKHLSTDLEAPPELMWTYDEAIAGFAVSPDGTLLAAQSEIGSRDITFYIWEVETGRQLITLQHEGGSRYPPTPVTFNAQGTRFAASPSDEVFVWDTSRKRPMLHLEGFNGSVDSLAFSADGRYLAIGHTTRGEDYIATISIWNLYSGEMHRVIQIEEEINIHGLAFSPDGRVLASGSDDLHDNIRLWDVETGEQIRKIDSKSDRSSALSFTPDGKYLIHRSFIYDPATGERVAMLGEESNSRFSPSGNFIAVTNSSFLYWYTNKISVWNASDFSLAFDLTHFYDRHTYNQLEFDGDNLHGSKTSDTYAINSGEQYLALPDDDDGGSDRNYFVRLCSIAQQKQIAAFKGNTPAVFNREGTILAAETDCGVTLRDVRTPEVSKTFANCLWRRLNLIDTTAIVFSPDGRIVAFTIDEYPTGDAVIEFWDMGTERVITTLRGHTKTIDAMVFSDDGRLFATASQDGTVRWWGVR
jgi:WD40 repeat protein